MEATQISMAYMELLLEFGASGTNVSRKYYAVDIETGHVTALDVRCGEMFTEVFNSVEAALEWMED